MFPVNDLSAGAATTPTADDPARILLVDDQQLVRSGFSLMLSVEDDVTVVGEAGNGQEAIKQARALKPHVTLMDVQMPVMDGIDATRAMVQEGLGKVIILTTFDRDDYLTAALEAGASGFLLKNTDPENLVRAIRSVVGGHALLAPEVTRRVIEGMVEGRASSSPSLSQSAPEGLDRLTAREREVLMLVGKGLSNAEIADRLFLGETTVKTHVSSCLAKLHLRDRVQAVVMAYEAGLILPGE